MKKHLLLCLAIALTTYNSQAQTDAINIIPSGNVGIGITTPAQKFHVAGGIEMAGQGIEGNTTNRIYRNLTTNSWDGPLTGALVIQTNVPQDDHTMTQVWINLKRVYSNGNTNCEFVVSGYWSSEANGGFSGLGHTNYCSDKLRVRLMRNTATGMVAIVIGETNTAWSYPNYSVTKISAHYGIPAGDAYANGWTGNITSDLSGFINSDDVPDITAVAPTSGSGNYIQNQITGAQTTSNFWISNTGRAAAFQLNDANTSLTEGGGDALRIGTSTGYIDIGSQGASWAHIQTDRPSFYLNTKTTVDGNVEPYTTNARDLGSTSLRWRDVYSYYHNVTPGDGYGIRFWESDSYKIHMGNAAENHYGPVTDYSIKTNMSNNAGRGWTWGVSGSTPVAAIEATTGNMQIGGNFAQGPLIARPRATWSVAGASTGAVIIKLPGTTANYGMLHMEVDVYEYGSTATTTYILGGHNWNAQWYNYNCQTIGSSDKKVRLAVIGGQYAIVLGETGSSWSYGHVVLSKITNGGYYSANMDLGGTYTVYQDNAPTLTWSTGDLNSSTNPAISTNYIQNQFTSAQSANYWVSGNARIEGNTYIGSNANNYFYPGGNRINVFAEGTSDVAEFASYGLYLPKTNAYNLYIGGGAQLAYGTAGYIDFKNEGGISTNSGTLNMYFKNTGNVGVGTTTASVRLHVNGNAFFDLPAGGGALENSLTIKKTGQPQIGFGTYPGAWTPALQIQNNDNSRYVWLSPLDNASGGNARLVTGGSDFSIYPSNALASTFSSSGDVTTARYHFSQYFNSSDNSVGSGVTGVMVKQGDNYLRTGTAAGVLSYLGVTAPTGDNLGNHTATTYLQMGAQWINVNGGGIYSSGYGNHFWPPNSSYWNMNSNYGMHVRRMDGTSMGYLYHDNGSSFGLLSPGGSWRVRVDDSNTEVYGSGFYAPTSYIGFIYDRNDNAYYIDPNGNSVINTVRVAGGSPAAGKVLTSSDGAGNATWEYPSNAWEYVGDDARVVCNGGAADLVYEWGIQYNNSGTILRVTCNRWNVGYRVCSYPPYPTGDSEPFRWGGVCWIWGTSSGWDDACSRYYHSYYYQTDAGKYEMWGGNGCDQNPSVYRRKL